MLRALLWDVDGTIAETERDGHRVAFNRAFGELGLPWHWGVADYGPLLEVTGGRERLQHFMATRSDAPPAGAARDALAAALHQRKNAAYAEIVASGQLPARPGVLQLVAMCQAAGVVQAVATTTSRANVDALFTSLWGPAWQHIFTVVVCAEDAPLKKPQPQAYLLALQRLGVSACDAFALEDSPNGLHAANAAGLACGVTRSVYFAQQAFDGAAWVVDSLEGAPPLAEWARVR
jgi:HAD superfamily hydrolase (TIGR01509 family)